MLEHWRVSQHVWYDEESDVRAADVDLIKMADTAVAGSNGDVFELHIHVVFRWRTSQHKRG